MSDLKLSKELRQISYGNSRHIDLAKISQLADKAIVIEAKLEAMESRLLQASHLIEGVGVLSDWEGRAADWLGITSEQQEQEDDE